MDGKGYFTSTSLESLNSRDYRLSFSALRQATPSKNGSSQPSDTHDNQKRQREVNKAKASWFLPKFLPPPPQKKVILTMSNESLNESIKYIMLPMLLHIYSHLYFKCAKLNFASMNTFLFVFHPKFHPKKKVDKVLGIVDKRS